MKVEGILLTDEKSEYTTDEDSGYEQLEVTEDGMHHLAETAVGTPISIGFSSDIDQTVGEILDAEFVEGEGIRYTAEVDAETIDDEHDIAPAMVSDNGELKKTVRVGIVPEATDDVGDWSEVDESE